jgi:hypothetical protein
MIGKSARSGAGAENVPFPAANVTRFRHAVQIQVRSLYEAAPVEPLAYEAHEPTGNCGCCRPNWRRLRRRPHFATPPGLLYAGAVTARKKARNPAHSLGCGVSLEHRPEPVPRSGCCSIAHVFGKRLSSTEALGDKTVLCLVQLSWTLLRRHTFPLDGKVHQSNGHQRANCKISAVSVFSRAHEKQIGIPIWGAGSFPNGQTRK